MGTNKQHPDYIAKQPTDPELKVQGILNAKKLSKNYSIDQLIKERKVRISRHDMKDEKTYFTAEDRKRQFEKMYQDPKLMKPVDEEEDILPRIA